MSYKFKVLAGDFHKQTEYINGHKVNLSSDDSFCKWLFGEKINLKRDIAAIEILTEENKKRIGSALGWAAIGTITLGPAGLIAGAILGGNGKEVTVAVQLKDGRKFIAVIPIKLYQNIVQ